MPFLKYATPSEVKYIMREIHEGTYRNHVGGQSLAFKAPRQGYYRPTIKADCMEYPYKYNKRQFGPISKAHLEELTSMASPWPSYKNIVYRYRVPHTIIFHNGTKFDCDEFKEFCDNLQIKKVFLLVARPQANAQVEALNKVIKHNLKTKFENLKKRWADNLPEVLWAYRTTARSTTRETPFSLAYGYEALVPIELGIGSLKRDNFDPEQNMITMTRA